MVTLLSELWSDECKRTEERKLKTSDLSALPGHTFWAGESQCWDPWQSSHHTFMESSGRSILIQDVINPQPSDLRGISTQNNTEKDKDRESGKRTEITANSNICWVHIMSQSHTRGPFNPHNLLRNYPHFTEKLGSLQVTSWLWFLEIKPQRQVWNPSSVTP